MRYFPMAFRTRSRQRWARGLGGSGQRTEREMLTGRLHLAEGLHLWPLACGKHLTHVAG